MRPLLLVSTLACLFLIAACSPTSERDFGSLSTNPSLPPELYQTWKHSYEEEASDSGSEVYRPVSWDLPVVRWRDQFTLSSDGTLEWIAPGSTDLPYAVSGRWWSDSFDPAIVHLQPDGHDMSSYRLLSVAEERLVLEPVPN